MLGIGSNIQPAIGAVAELHGKSDGDGKGSGWSSRGVLPGQQQPGVALGGAHDLVAEVLTDLVELLVEGLAQAE